jgi:hypothetical protein
MLNDITYERVLDETRAIIGDPDDVARQLTYIRDTFGEVSELPDQLRDDGQGQGTPEHRAVRPARDAELPLRAKEEDP